MPEVDLRSYFPELKRTITLPDGEDYLVRDMSDIPIGTFNRIVDDEKNFKDMKFLERHAIERQHIQTLVVTPVTVRGVAPKGERTLRLAGDGRLDLEPGDVVHLTGGLYLERNVVDSVSEDGQTATMQNAWRFDASDGARVYRSVRPAVLDLLSFVEFAALAVKVKTPESGTEAAEESAENPQPAASGSTS